jgi:hypothetical protein
MARQLDVSSKYFFHVFRTEEKYSIFVSVDRGGRGESAVHVAMLEIIAGQPGKRDQLFCWQQLCVDSSP